MTKCHIMLLTSYHMDQCTFMYKKPNQTNTMWHVLHQNNTNTSVFRCFSVFANTQYRKWLQPTILTLTLTERVPLINYWWLFSIILNVFDDSSRVRHAANLETRTGGTLTFDRKGEQRAWHKEGRVLAEAIKKIFRPQSTASHRNSFEWRQFENWHSLDSKYIWGMFLISVKSSAKNERNRLKLCRKWETL